MSKRMVDAFFPASVKVINGGSFTRLSFLYNDVVFPEAIAEECPEYIITLEQQIRIRQPCLLLAAFWGTWIGLVGFQRLYRRRDNPYWALALLTFGLMNISAIWVHCLWAAPQTDYPTNYPVFWTIDTYMTGVSGCCLLLGSLEELGVQWNPVLMRSVSVSFLSKVLQLLGVLCILFFILDPSPGTVMASFPLELWYLLPPLLAAWPVAVWMFQDALFETFGKGRLSVQFASFLSSGQWAFISAIMVAGVLGLAMDHFWCPLLGNTLARDLMSANTLVFLGCDLAFWGILAMSSERQLLKDARIKKQE